MRIGVVLLALLSSAIPANGTPVVPAREPTSQNVERSAVGTLDHVDATASHITVGTPSGKLTIQVQAGATIRQGSKTIKPSDLASHRGERVKVRYKENAGQRRTDWIMLAVPDRR